MKGIIFEHKKHGVFVLDKLGCFRFVRGFTELPIGSEIIFSIGNEDGPSNLINFPSMQERNTASR